MAGGRLFEAKALVTVPPGPTSPPSRRTSRSSRPRSWSTSPSPRTPTSDPSSPRTPVCRLPTSQHRGARARHPASRQLQTDADGERREDVRCARDVERQPFPAGAESSRPLRGTTKSVASRILPAGRSARWAGSPSGSPPKAGARSVAHRTHLGPRDRQHELVPAHGREGEAGRRRPARRGQPRDPRPRRRERPAGPRAGPPRPGPRRGRHRRGPSARSSSCSSPASSRGERGLRRPPSSNRRGTRRQHHDRPRSAGSSRATP